MAEKDFQQAVREYAQLKGWADYSTWDSRHGPAGWPDLVLIRPPRIVIAELKTETGRLADAQRKTIALLLGCSGVETFLWRPGDWESIEEVLT